MAGSANIYLGSVETQAASETGAVGISMSIDFYGYLTQSKNPDTEYIVPEGQSIVNADPIAIAATSSKKNEAVAFIDFIFTPEGQALWLNPSIKRMPIMREAFDTPVGQQNLDLYTVFNDTVKNIGIDFNDSLSLEINTAFTKYFEAVFTDAHDDLVDCWDLMVDAFYNGNITESQLNDFADQMGHPVTIEDPDGGGPQEFTIAYARQINLDMVYNSVYAGQMQNLWTAAAKAQYLAVYNAVLALM
jgi:ABC-type glycerol-3-phosphate transport system substrate-binding protein